MVKNLHMDAWSVSKHDFPVNRSDSEKLAFCVRYAILAPSPYNSQPWFFSIKGKTVSVFADRRYGLPVTDPDDRGLVIATAAALYNLRLAIRYFGYEEKTDYLPDPERESLIARVTLGGHKGENAITKNDKKRFEHITQFEFNHSYFPEKTISDEGIEALKDAADSEHAWLYICNDTDKKNILRMTAEADHVQFANKNFRREYSMWTDRRRVNSGDGLPQYAQSFSESMNRFTATAARRFKNQEGAVISDIDMLRAFPLLTILGSVRGGATERIMTGQALMRLCLTAACHDLSVSMLNQVCEVPELRLMLHDEINQQGRAHVLLRIGYGGKPPLNARRSLSSVLDIDGKPYDASLYAIKSESAQPANIFQKIGKVFLAKRA